LIYDFGVKEFEEILLETSILKGVILNEFMTVKDEVSLVIRGAGSKESSN